ncbi:MAG: primosomal protein N' [Candidatus Kapabacteria bacterium]|nr:primosomal protein N' [Candidatus Kapabacteria bacterium]
MISLHRTAHSSNRTAIYCESGWVNCRMPIRVAVPIPRLEPLTYDLPAGLSVMCGMRVLVPVGSRTLAGTVVDTDATGVDGMKPILEVLDETPTFSEEMLELTRKVADYYMAGWGEVLSAALPSWQRPSSTIRIHRLRAVSSTELSEMKRRAPRRAALLEVIDDVRGDVSLSYLQKRLRTSSVSDQLHALVRDGFITLITRAAVPPTRRTVRSVCVAEGYRSDESALRELFDLLDRRAPKQSLALATIWMVTGGSARPVAITEVLQRSGVSASVVDSLIERGAVELSHEAVDLSQAEATRADETMLDMTPAQQAALERIIKGLNERRFDPILLHGVTGSGKTLVYQHALRHIIDEGAAAIVLVPEISLTPQLGDRFVSAFGDRVAILHSRLTDAERLHQLDRISKGDVSVVIGPRSAIFCSIPRLRLIVVDEEHEPSYKQDDPSPRYHGRDVAMMRAKINSCPIVLGSATPSFETIQNVRLGRFAVAEIPTRADGATSPAIRVVDMRRNHKLKTVYGSFSHDAIDAIAARIRDGMGTIIFLNRRGFSSELQCRDCGHTPHCPNCDVSLTFHQVPSSLRCHYCGYATQLVKSCVECGSVDVAELGSGTQRVEAELQEALQERCGLTARIARVDADTTSRRGMLRTTLKAFEKGDLDVLVGTQMIAKGLDISRVTLVVVVNADQSLHMSDFRASERTYQLLTQVAGRAGRAASLHGEVIVQTSTPEHPVIGVVSDGERLHGMVTEWIDAEMSVRAEVGYPPFTRFIVIEVSSMDLEHAERHAAILGALLPQSTAYHSRSTVVTPAVGRVRNHYRRVIVVRNDKSQDPSGQKVRSLLRSVLDTYYAKYASSDVRVSIDIDASGSL